MDDDGLFGFEKEIVPGPLTVFQYPNPNVGLLATRKVLSPQIL
jgi:hypothetical protein